MQSSSIITQKPISVTPKEKRNYDSHRAGNLPHPPSRNFPHAATMTTSLTYTSPTRSHSHSLNGHEECPRQLLKRWRIPNRYRWGHFKLSPKRAIFSCKFKWTPIQSLIFSSQIFELNFTNPQINNSPLAKKKRWIKYKKSRKQRNIAEIHHVEMLSTCLQHLTYLWWHTNDHHPRRSNTNHTRSMAHRAQTVESE